MKSGVIICLLLIYSVQSEHAFSLFSNPEGTINPPDVKNAEVTTFVDIMSPHGTAENTREQYEKTVRVTNQVTANELYTPSYMLPSFTRFNAKETHKSRAEIRTSKKTTNPTMPISISDILKRRRMIRTSEATHTEEKQNKTRIKKYAKKIKKLKSSSLKVSTVNTASEIDDEEIETTIDDIEEVTEVITLRPHNLDRLYPPNPLVDYFSTYTKRRGTDPFFRPLIRVGNEFVRLTWPSRVPHATSPPTVRFLRITGYEEILDAVRKFIKGKREVNAPSKMPVITPLEDNVIESSRRVVAALLRVEGIQETAGNMLMAALREGQLRPQEPWRMGRLGTVLHDAETEPALVRATGKGALAQLEHHATNPRPGALDALARNILRRNHIHMCYAQLWIDLVQRVSKSMQLIVEDDLKNFEKAVYFIQPCSIKRTSTTSSTPIENELKTGKKRSKRIKHIRKLIKGFKND